MARIPVVTYFDTDTGELVFEHPAADGVGDVRLDVRSAQTPADQTDRLDAIKAQFVPTWRPGITVTAGEVYAHAGKRYRIVQTHTTQAHFPPDGPGLAALYVEAT